MHILRMSRWRRGEEIQRYFPEWADRIERSGVSVESDRNSYSAGGYAEEFGYRAQPGLPLPARLLAGQPEGHKLWRTRQGAFHPGYPECARPLDRDGFLAVAAPAELGRARSGPPDNGTAPAPNAAAPPHISALKIIQLRRPVSAKPGSLAQVRSMWNVLRFFARHLNGY